MQTLQVLQIIGNTQLEVPTYIRDWCCILYKMKIIQSLDVTSNRMFSVMIQSLSVICNRMFPVMKS